METPVHTIDKEILDKGILPKLGHQLVSVYDLISGPGTTEKQRISRQLAEAGRYRFIDRMI